MSSNQGKRRKYRELENRDLESGSQVSSRERSPRVRQVELPSSSHEVPMDTSPDAPDYYFATRNDTTNNVEYNTYRVQNITLLQNLSGREEKLEVLRVQMNEAIESVKNCVDINERIKREETQKRITEQFNQQKQLVDLTRQELSSMRDKMENYGKNLEQSLKNALDFKDREQKKNR